MVTHLSTNPVRLNPLHLQQCSLRLFRICSVAAVVLFSLLSFDRSVVYSQCFPLTLASYCEYRISSIKLLLISCSYHRRRYSTEQISVITIKIKRSFNIFDYSQMLLVKLKVLLR